jgi:hypothetical protein
MSGSGLLSALVPPALSSAGAVEIVVAALAGCPVCWPKDFNVAPAKPAQVQFVLQLSCNLWFSVASALQLLQEDVVSG